MTKNRMISLVLSVLICLVLVSSAAFIAEEAVHDCSGAECQVCLCLDACLAQLHTLTTVTACLGALFFCAVLLSSIPQRMLGSGGLGTLVSLKVRLTI